MIIIYDENYTTNVIEKHQEDITATYAIGSWAFIRRDYIRSKEAGVNMSEARYWVEDLDTGAVYQVYPVYNKLSEKEVIWLKLVAEGVTPDD